MENSMEVPAWFLYSQGLCEGTIPPDFPRSFKNLMSLQQRLFVCVHLAYPSRGRQAIILFVLKEAADYGFLYLGL